MNAITPSATQQSQPQTTRRPLTWDGFWNNPEIEELFHASILPLKRYVWLTRNTESPKQYHLWSLLSLTAAIASNHVTINAGVIGKKRLNLGVVLSGRPAIRKSSAISFMQRFAQAGHLNLGPTDTGAARHGVMAAMQIRWQDDIREDLEKAVSLSGLADLVTDSVMPTGLKRSTRPASIYFASKELGRLLTAQTRELLDFFADGIDGEPIYYQTKTGSVRLPAPLINLLGATTPGSLPHILPRDSHDHGLLSRFIFVYASHPETAVPIPPAVSEQEQLLAAELIARLSRIPTDAGEEIAFSPEAEAEYRNLYEYSISTLEFKLNAYAGRRADHLIKLSGLICLLRGESPYLVSVEDVGLAHLILNLTEQQMEGAYAGLDRGVDGRMYATVREILESVSEKHGQENEFVIVAALYRAGFREEEIVGGMQRLKNSKRLVARGETIHLGDNVGAEKAAVYVRGLRRRLGLSS